LHLKVKGVDVEGLVSAVSRWVGDEVGGLRRGVVVFVPPGSSRFEVVKRLRDLIDVVYAYREETGVSSYRDVEQPERLATDGPRRQPPPRPPLKAPRDGGVSPRGGNPRQEARENSLSEIPHLDTSQKTRHRPIRRTQA
jgi:hypothetical protein